MKGSLGFAFALGAVALVWTVAGRAAPPRTAVLRSEGHAVATQEETRSDADRAPTARESAGQSRALARASDLFAIRVAIESGSRNFAYVDRLTSSLRSYSLFAAPLGVVDAEVYPLARTGLAGLKDFGLTFDYGRAFGLSSDDSAGTTLNTNWSLLDVGARERIPIGRAWLLGLHGGYGEMTYTFDGSLETPAALPGVQYRFVRGGADARVALGPFSLSAYGSYLSVFSTGPIGAYFARGSVGGVEGRLGLARDLGFGFEVSIDVAYTRYFYAFNPQPGDAYVAGGALDQMAFGSLGVAYVFR
jgi:hypothetical protein